MRREMGDLAEEQGKTRLCLLYGMRVRGGHQQRRLQVHLGEKTRDAESMDCVRVDLC